MKKILVVDDVKGWRDYHELRLTEFLDEVEIHCAESARAGYEKVMENNDSPYDVIITDMQMENDFEPKYAGEWFIEQIKTFKNYLHTKIVIVSATYNIKQIAENYGVDCIPKKTALNFPNSYGLFLS